MIMKDFDKYCTRQQTLRANKLNAPLNWRAFPTNVVKKKEKELEDFIDKVISDGFDVEYKDGIMTFLFQSPTLSQMREWLKTKDIYISVNHNSAGYSSWLKTIKDNKEISENLGYCNEEDEAISKGIDYALDYLEGNIVFNN